MAKNNDEILNELFFKKKSYTEKMGEKQAQYTPVKSTGSITSLFNGNSENGFIISDTDEVKKRIVGALGMAMGSNTVRSMANKAIKSFPIIVSDDISPETVVIVKTMMEEQYASYIDLLVSNQIINLSDYSTDNSDGNIAIQALNRIDGTDFGNGRLARKAQTGNLSLDDVMRNNPGWQFLRTNENMEYTTGNAILDSLMENAVIVPSEYANVTACKLYEELSLNEASPATMAYSAYFGANATDDEITDDNIKARIIDMKGASGNTWATNFAGFVPGDTFVNMTSKQLYTRNANGTWGRVTRKDEAPKEDPVKRLNDAIKSFDTEDYVSDYKKYRYYTNTETNGSSIKRYGALVNPNVMVNSDDLKASLDRAIGQLITGENASTPEEKEIAAYVRDRFEKASFLLAEKRIAGSEYVAYLRDRLSIPVASATAADIIRKFPTADVRFQGLSVAPDEHTGYGDMLRRNIDANRKYVIGTIVPRIVGITAKDVAIVTGSALGVGGSAAIVAGLASGPIGWIALGGALVGGGTAALIRAIMKKRPVQDTYDNSMYGWERVEYLIDQIDFGRKELLNHKRAMDDSTQEAYRKDEAKWFKEFSDQMVHIYKSANSLTESIVTIEPYAYKMTDRQIEESFSFLEAFDEEICADDELLAETEMMTEAAKYLISTSSPKDIIVKQTKYNSKDVASMVPLYGTRDTVAYGSVEYDRRDIKDRKFNEPLILTIKFKERYSDGKYSDNELTAVIGILGVVTRVPSSEMAYILKSNAEGKTLRDFFKAEGGNNAKDLIGNLLADFSKSKYAEKLPTSGKVWSNLEKISALAIANKLAGANNGNISNAHLVFSQREIDEVKNELGIDYLKNAKLTAQLMKKYSAFMIAVCNDVMQYLYTFSDPDAISWDDAPYSAYMGKSNSDQLLSAFTQYNRMKI